MINWLLYNYENISHDDYIRTLGCDQKVRGEWRRPTYQEDRSSRDQVRINHPYHYYNHRSLSESSCLSNLEGLFSSWKVCGREGEDHGNEIKKRLWGRIIAVCLLGNKLDVFLLQKSCHRSTPIGCACVFVFLMVMMLSSDRIPNSIDIRFE